MYTKAVNTTLNGRFREQWVRYVCFSHVTWRHVTCTGHWRNLTHICTVEEKLWIYNRKLQDYLDWLIVSGQSAKFVAGIGMDACITPIRHGGLSLVQSTSFFYVLVDDPYMMVNWFFLFSYLFLRRILLWEIALAQAILERFCQSNFTCKLS